MLGSNVREEREVWSPRHEVPGGCSARSRVFTKPASHLVTSHGHDFTCLPHPSHPKASIQLDTPDRGAGQHLQSRLAKSPRGQNSEQRHLSPSGFCGPIRTETHQEKCKLPTGFPGTCANTQGGNCFPNALPSPFPSRKRRSEEFMQSVTSSEHDPPCWRPVRGAAS